MKIKKFVIVACLAFLPFLLLSQAGDVGAKNAIKAPEVNLFACLPSFFGSESIVMKPTFTISNPNDFLIEIRMDYQLNAGEQIVGKAMLPALYIPANKTVEVIDACVLPFRLFFVEKLLAGKSKPESVEIVGKMWKSWSGKRPGAVPEDSWKKMSDKKPVMMATGAVIVFSEKGQQIFQFKSEWQE